MKLLQKETARSRCSRSTVKCHYHGTTISGKVFDSSVKRGTPASFPLNRVIAVGLKHFN
ncbi:FKBP-type peptidyl-prolyl cis-trans isomerase [Chryseobacterium wanjuense]